MGTHFFVQYLAAIRNFDGDATSPALCMTSDGPLSVYYAPFDWVNPGARVVLVGITPGRTQAVNALVEAKRQLTSGAAPEQALRSAKLTGGFSGAMRPNLTAMLDRIGLAKWLKISGCEQLFGASSHLLQSSSVLPFPVFLNAENYNGTPDIVTTPLLRQMVVGHFVPMAKALPEAVFLPLGSVPSKVLTWLVFQGHLNPKSILQGLPHPSGANAERIQYFLGKKEAAKLSAKTDPVKLDVARLRLESMVASLA